MIEIETKTREILVYILTNVLNIMNVQIFLSPNLFNARLQPPQLRIP